MVGENLLVDNQNKIITNLNEVLTLFFMLGSNDIKQPLLVLRVGRNPKVRRFKEYIDDKKNTTRWREVSHSGVKETDGYPYPSKINIKSSLSITTTKLWESNYSDYQQYLFNRICKYKECFLTPIR